VKRIIIKLGTVHLVGSYLVIDDGTMHGVNRVKLNGAGLDMLLCCGHPWNGSVSPVFGAVLQFISG
jgi:hypothetical protein